MAEDKKSGDGLGVFINNVVLPVCRLAPYHNLDKPDTGGRFAKGRYGCTVLIPKAASLASLEAAIKAAWEELKDKAWKGVQLAHVLRPWADGDMKAEKDGYAGHWALKMLNAKTPPWLKDQKKNQATADIFYPGCFVQGLLTAIAWEKPEERVYIQPDGSELKKKVVIRSVTFRPDVIMFVRDGEPLAGGGGRSADLSMLPDVVDPGADDPSNYTL